MYGLDPSRRIQALITQLVFGFSGIILFLLGVWSFLVHEPLLRKLIALNVMGAGVFHVLVAVAYRGTDTAPDPIPQALALTATTIPVSTRA